MKYKNGDKVIINSHIWWPDGGTGVVSITPKIAVEMTEGTEKVNSTQRTIKGQSSIITSTWVEFDKPIQDSDGDGPYTAGEVELKFLSHLPK